MAGRPSKPVQLIKLEGNKDRRTKAELEYREKFEKSLYTGTTFKESPAVKEDPVVGSKLKVFQGDMVNFQIIRTDRQRISSCGNGAVAVKMQPSAKEEVFWTSSSRRALMECLPNSLT